MQTLQTSKKQTSKNILVFHGYKIAIR